MADVCIKDKVMRKRTQPPPVWGDCSVQQIHSFLLYIKSSTKLHKAYGNIVWSNMENDVAEFVQKCLNCTDSKTGEHVPRPYREAGNATKVGQVLHFDCLHVRESDFLH
ncbi:unnamed protein product, partial [Discosporangium mesarthrocarpum]